MTGQLAQVSARIESTRALGSVIGAMRGVAAARSLEARSRLAGVRAYAQTVGTAIGQALALLPAGLAEAGPPPGDAPLVIALCAEQGFVGNFNERIVDAALDAAGPGELFVVGDRGLMLLAARERTPAWDAAMAAHTEELPALADRIAQALYARLADGESGRVLLVHAQPTAAGVGFELVRASLLPFDYSRFAAARQGREPVINLSPQRLLAQLAEEYVYAQLCEALVLSFAAENEARMQAMITAHSNVERRREALEAEFRRVRQSEITAEIVQLSSSRL